MKVKLLLGALLLCGIQSLAQKTSDPVIMTINGQPVSRSEFEYSYNKNNAEGVIDKKSVEEYVDLFINYRLRVAAAMEARLDTMKSFQNEFAGYRDQQIRPSVITDADVEAEARRIYEESKARAVSNGGLVKVAHILALMKQKATPDEERRAKLRIDSVYQALLKGADFAAEARRLSDDKGSAANGGELPWIGKGQTLKEFEDVAFSLKPGEMSKPFKSPAGWHIVLMKQRQTFFSYDSVKADIIRFIDQRGLREQVIDRKLDSLARTAAPPSTSAKILEDKMLEMETKDPNLKYLIQEYHDGLLLYEISNRTVWEKAEKDENGLLDYFKKHKKRYVWDTPRYKGIAYRTRSKDDIKAVRKTVKGLPFSAWGDRLRTIFNKDSVLRIKVVKGLFRKGDNALVDRMVFKKDTMDTPVKDYPFVAVYGKKLKAPKELDDVRSLVLADYQEELEREWVAQLRKRFPFTVDRNVLSTVNKH